MKKIIITVEPTAHGLTVTDSNGGSHTVQGERELGRKVMQIMGDPTIPEIKIAEREPVVGIVATLSRKLFPKHAALIDASEPVAHQLAAARRRKGRD